MKRPLQIILFFLVPLFAWGQRNINIDSLIRVALLPQNNVSTVTSSNRDSLFKQLPFAKSPKERIKLIYEIIGNGTPNSKEILKYHYKILEWARKNNNAITEAVITAELGYNLYENGENTDGQQMDIAALKMAEKTGDNQVMGIAYLNLADCYEYNNSLAKFYSQKALRYSKLAGDNLFVAFELYSLGAVAAREHKKDSALYFARKSLAFDVSKNLPVGIPNSLTQLAAAETDDRLKLKYDRAAAEIAVIKLDTSELIPGWTTLALYYRIGRNISKFVLNFGFRIYDFGFSQS